MMNYKQRRIRYLFLLPIQHLAKGSKESHGNLNNVSVLVEIRSRKQSRRSRHLFWRIGEQNLWTCGLFPPGSPTYKLPVHDSEQTSSYIG